MLGFIDDSGVYKGGIENFIESLERVYRAFIESFIGNNVESL